MLDVHPHLEGGRGVAGHAGYGDGALHGRVVVDGEVREVLEVLSGRRSCCTRQRWRRSGHDTGSEGLRSAGPVSRPKLSEALFAVLEQELAKGPVAHGWPDQTWTLARIRTLIGRRFHKSMTLSAIARMLHRHGFSHQVPVRRAIERDEEAVAGWVKETWPQVEGPWRRSMPGCASKTRPASR
ncbi:winged helix-turn-helix domain-containing protein [Streptomyces sp. NPDC059466]|uniref:helix-turn-helix domain-containing protein n=1 Tax=Streptomyces sp. NPDC059466 TaxID=3346843 RepID=UPI00367C6807